QRLGLRLAGDRDQGRLRLPTPPLLERRRPRLRHRRAVLLGTTPRVPPTSTTVAGTIWWPNGTDRPRTCTSTAFWTCPVLPPEPWPPTPTTWPSERTWNRPGGTGTARSTRPP